MIYFSGMLNDKNASLPELPIFDGGGLSNIVVTSDEIESILKALRFYS